MGNLFVVGIGPGDESGMTKAASAALERAELIVGYSKYVDLVSPLFPDKQYLQTGMTREVERCQLALSRAEQGRDVALVCSGDAGVYGMAGLVLELLNGHEHVCVEVIPGVTAALAGAALLGAPFTNDFAVISLSDLLTPWETIKKRIACAAMGDFCIALYNPSSKRRAHALKSACGILLEHKSPDTVCGIAKNIGREGQEASTLSLAQLMDTPVDMFTTVFIGNSETRLIRDRMVTPRGYRFG